MCNPHLRPLVILLAVLAILAGTALRFTQLPHKVFWHDEAHTALRVSGYTTQAFLSAAFVNRIYTRDALLGFQHPAAGQGWGATLRALASRPEHAPLYYLLARAGFLFTDDARLATRGVAALLSVLLLPAAWWLWREAFGRAPDGVGAWPLLALLALSPLQLVYAQEGRQYSLWAVATLALCAALLYACRHNDRRGWAVYALLATAGLYSHLMLMAVLAAHALWVLGWRRALLRPFAQAAAAAMVLFAPWLALFVAGREDVAVVTAWMHAAVPLAQLASAWLAHLTHLFVDRGDLLYAHPAVLPVTVFGLYVTARHAPAVARRLLFLVLLATAGVVIGPDLLAGGRRSQEARYLLPALLMLTFMVAFALTRTLQARQPLPAAMALAVWIALLGTSLWSDLRFVQAESWWNKSMSRANHQVARIVDAADRPLVLTADGETNPGELLSLAHEVAAGTRFMPLDRDRPPEPRGLDGTVFLVTPSAELLAHFAAHGAVTELHRGGRLWSFTRNRRLSLLNGRGATVNR